MVDKMLFDRFAEELGSLSQDRAGLNGDTQRQGFVLFNNRGGGTLGDPLLRPKDQHPRLTIADHDPVDDNGALHVQERRTGQTAGRRERQLIDRKRWARPSERLEFVEARHDMPLEASYYERLTVVHAMNAISVADNTDCLEWLDRRLPPLESVKPLFRLGEDELHPEKREISLKFLVFHDPCRLQESVGTGQTDSRLAASGGGLKHDVARSEHKSVTEGKCGAADLAFDCEGVARSCGR
jgi:hypothetical protein